ncbi:MAG: hypothetical protein IKO56_00930 [Alphaproteobacteria bacterium]|nr:hypothetical protein [Alphaproteobacteria bacterium]
MDKALKILGALLGIFAGILLIVIGVYNIVINIQQGSFFALTWLLAPVFGGWFIDLGCGEFKSK